MARARRLDACDWLGSCPALLLLSADTTQPPQALTDQPREHATHFAWLEADAIVQNVGLWAAESALGSVVIAGFDDARAASIAQQLLPDRHQLLALLAIGEPKTCVRN